jgi:hypothetical protein
MAYSGYSAANSVFLWLILIIFISLSRKLVFASTPVTLNVACLIHSNSANDTSNVYVSNFTALEYSVDYPAQKSYVQALLLWAERIAESGAILMENTALTLVNINLQFIDLGPVDPNDLSMAFNEGIADELWPRLSDGFTHDRIDQLTQNITSANNILGEPYSIIITPYLTADWVVKTFASACEVNNACIVMAINNPNPSLYISNPAANLPIRLHPNTFSIRTDNNDVFSSYTEIFVVREIERVALIVSNHSKLFAHNIYQSTLYNLQLYNMQLVEFSELSSNSTLSSDSALSLAHSLSGPGVELIYMLAPASDTIFASNILALLQAFKQISYVPKALVVAGGVANYVKYLSSDETAAFIYTDDVWDWRLKGKHYRTVQSTYSAELFPATEAEDSPQVYYSAYTQRWKAEYYGSFDEQSDLLIAAVTNQGPTVLQKALEQCNSLAIDDLRTCILQLSCPSVLGRLQFDSYGRLVFQPHVVSQFLPNSDRYIVSPSLTLGATSNPVFPMPTWSERVFAPQYFNTPMEKIVLAFNCICIAYSLFLLWIVLSLNSHVVIRASSPTFCAFVIIGAVLTIASGFFDSLHVNDVHCELHRWTLTLGFTTMFSGLFTKTWRVWRIYAKGDLRLVQITDADLAKMMGGIVGVDIALNTVWNILAPMTSELVIADPFRPASNYYTCFISDIAKIFIYIHVALKLGLIFFGVVLTWLARDVPSQFNETPYIAACIYNAAIVLGFIVPIVGTQVGGRANSYWIMSTAGMFLCTVTVSILFIPKLYLIFGGPQARRKINDSRYDSRLEDSKLESSMLHSMERSVSGNNPNNPNSGAPQFSPVKAPDAQNNAAVLITSPPKSHRTARSSRPRSVIYPKSVSKERLSRDGITMMEGSPKSLKERKEKKNPRELKFKVLVEPPQEHTSSLYSQHSSSPHNATVSHNISVTVQVNTNLPITPTAQAITTNTNIFISAGNNSSGGENSPVNHGQLSPPRPRAAMRNLKESLAQSKRSSESNISNPPSAHSPLKSILRPTRFTFICACKEERIKHMARVNGLRRELASLQTENKAVSRENILLKQTFSQLQSQLEADRKVIQYNDESYAYPFALNPLHFESSTDFNDSLLHHNVRLPNTICDSGANHSMNPFVRQQSVPLIAQGHHYNLSGITIANNHSYMRGSRSRANSIEDQSSCTFKRSFTGGMNYRGGLLNNPSLANDIQSFNNSHTNNTSGSSSPQDNELRGGSESNLLNAAGSQSSLNNAIGVQHVNAVPQLHVQQHSDNESKESQSHSPTNTKDKVLSNTNEPGNMLSPTPTTTALCSDGELEAENEHTIHQQRITNSHTGQAILELISAAEDVTAAIDKLVTKTNDNSDSNTNGSNHEDCAENPGPFLSPQSQRQPEGLQKALLRNPSHEDINYEEIEGILNKSAATKKG